MTYKDIMKNVRVNIKTYTMVIALLLIWGLFGILTNGIFFNPRNISNLFRQMTIISFLAIGMVLIIVTGNIDLSVGSVTGFISAIVADLQARRLPDILPEMFPEMDIAHLGMLSTGVAIVCGLGVGLLIGIWQGTLTAYLRIPAFIVTLGGMMIFRGGILWITKGATVVPIENSLRIIAQGYQPKIVGVVIAIVVIFCIFFYTFWNRKQKKSYGFPLPHLAVDSAKAGGFSLLILTYIIYINMYKGLQNPIIILACVAVVFSYLSTNTRLGRYAYALGGNQEATRLSGVDIRKSVFKIFLLMGLLCGVAGIVLTGYVAAGTTSGGKDYELSAIASCVIGGTSLMGGEGTIFGAIIGSLIMASLLNGMSLLSLQPHWQYIIQGLVLIFAVFIDVTTKQKN